MQLVESIIVLLQSDFMPLTLTKFVYKNGANK